jgi:hypothetical protein
MTMPRNKLIQERIELRSWQPLDRLPRRPHFQHVGDTISSFQLFSIGCTSRNAITSQRVIHLLPSNVLWNRAEIWRWDGATVRWVGVVLGVAGTVLRIWPVFVLGRRFSGFVAIQPGHELVTTGIYHLIRRPSYLGLLIQMFRDCINGGECFSQPALQWTKSPGSAY